MMSPTATIPTGRSRYLTWEKRNTTAKTIRIMATRISMPVSDPIASPISSENAGLPETVTVSPAGGSDMATMDLMFPTTCCCASMVTPGSRAMTLIVIRSEGSILSTISGGAWPMITLISALDDGRVPPFACFRRSTTPETLST
ncbi:hypothetical protein DSECCO2_557610 [anaerobic digester metagenome]